MSVQIKSLEMRCRRTAQRRGYILRKDRMRDPLGLNYGKWYVHSKEGALLHTFPDIGGVAYWLKLWQ